MKKLLLSGTALLLQAAASAQLQNTDFETWEIPVNEAIGGNRPVGWVRTNGIPMSETYFFYHNPVTEAQNGDYALRISIWYTYDIDMAKQTASINSRPAALNGFYTYTDNLVFSNFTGEIVDDEARATVKLTKVNPVSGEAEVIGTGTTVLPPSGTYAAFTCPIVYTSTETPDTIEVLFDCSLMDKTSGGSSFTSPTGVGVSSILTIDNVSLTAATLSSEEFELQNLRIFPNPARDTVEIPGFKGAAKIFDITGKLVANHESLINKIDVAALQTGVYVLSLKNNFGTHNIRLIKQ